MGEGVNFSVWQIQVIQPQWLVVQVGAFSACAVTTPPCPAHRTEHAQTDDITRHTRSHTGAKSTTQQTTGESEVVSHTRKPPNDKLLEENHSKSCLLTEFKASDTRDALMMRIQCFLMQLVAVIDGSVMVNTIR